MGVKKTIIVSIINRKDISFQVKQNYFIFSSNLKKLGGDESKQNKRNYIRN